MLVVVPGSLTQLREGWARVPGHTPVPKGNGTGACARLTRRQTVPVPTSRVVLRFISSGPFPVQKSPLPYSEAYVRGGTLGDIALVAGQTSHPSGYIAISINPLRWKGDRWFTPPVPDGPGPGGRQSTWGPHKAVFVSPLYLGILGPCWF